MRRIMVVYGTRPEAIKVAPLIIALANSALFEPVVVVTAQHRQLLDQVNEVFGITPDFDLDLLRPGQTLAEVTTRAISGLDTLMSGHRPDAVVVQGDTTTTLAGALAAFYHRVPVVHLEAGLRSGDLFSPFPEEANRSLTTQLANLHLAPTPANAGNLLDEAVPADSIIVTGNTVIDALLWSSQARGAYHDPRLLAMEDGRRVIVVTAHRRESWGDGMDGIGRALSRLAARERDVHIVFPIHPNPIVRQTLLPHLTGHPNVTVTEPLHYGDFTRLLRRSYLVLTDSGGIQEEAPSLGKPVLVMRDTTERPEAVRAGTACLVGTEESRIVAGVTTLLHSPEAYRRMANAINPYGDGQATDRALAALAHLFGLGPRPAPFRLPSEVARPVHGERRSPRPVGPGLISAGHSGRGPSHATSQQPRGRLRRPPSRPAAAQRTALADGPGAKRCGGGRGESRSDDS
ncbi:non-hydrolyzing UDP-N-acetylglucosamine 2-epimerase [Streptosporangium sp. NPDC000396]|uniref:non-hydrolyzing UDP-N-acetylglucosamine 2-epimerase n=1 Tax=Streptosporangium sp. NPDC000396 TaxID=3366185 RepID=UPI0036A17897